MGFIYIYICLEPNCCTILLFSLQLHLLTTLNYTITTAIPVPSVINSAMVISCCIKNDLNIYHENTMVFLFFWHCDYSFVTNLSLLQCKVVWAHILQTLIECIAFCFWLLDGIICIIIALLYGTELSKNRKLTNN